MSGHTVVAVFVIIGMMVDLAMLMVLCYTFDTDLAFTATTSHTHRRPPCFDSFEPLGYSAYLKFLDPHFGARSHYDWTGATNWARVKDLCDRNGLATRLAPALAGQGNDLEPGAVGHRAARHRIETKGQGFGLHRR
jgi:hypothetical protein